MEKLGQLTTAAAKDLQNSGSKRLGTSRKCSEAVFKSLSILADECVATGRLKPEMAPSLIQSLTKDLTEVPDQWVNHAIVNHKRKSPFFPALADLWEFIKPAWEQREAARRASLATRKARQFMALPAPDQPPAEVRNRQAAEAKALFDGFRYGTVDPITGEDIQERRRAALKRVQNPKPRTPEELIRDSKQIPA